MTPGSSPFRLEADEPEHDVGAARRVMEALGVEDAETKAEGLERPVYVRVHEIFTTGEHEFRFRMDPDEFVNGGDLELIQRKCGAGKYRIAVVTSKGAVIAQRTEKIGAPLEAPKPEPAAAELPGSLERLLEKLVADRAAPVPALPSGFLESVTAVAAAMSKSQSELMAPLLAALTQKDSRGDPTEKVLDVLLKGVELGRENSSSGGFGDTIRELLPGALRALQPPPGEGGTPAAPGKLPAPPTPPDPTLPPWARVISPHLPQLVGLASMRADPEYWAERVCAEIDGERLTFRDDQLARGLVFREEFFQLFPEAMEHRSWFELFYDGMRSELEQIRNDDDAEDDARAGAPTTEGGQ